MLLLSLVSPAHLSRQQASGSVQASLMNKPRPREEKPPGLEGRKIVITLRHNVSQHSTGEKVWGPGANQIIPLEY